MSEYHHIPAVVELAVTPPLDPDTPRTSLKGRGTPLAERARAVCARVGRSSLETRDALWAVLEAVSGLERTVDQLQRVLALRDQGIELRPELVHVGADGVGLQRRGTWEDGEAVQVYLSLELRDCVQLLCLPGTVEQGSDGAFVRFEDLRREERDLLVAFVFQQEAKERRRALDATH